MLAKMVLVVIVLVILCIATTTTSAAAVAMVRDERQRYHPIDCSILSECDGSWECIELLTNLYRLDCFVTPVSKKSFVGGGKRGGLKNLEKIFLGSYMTRMG
uniref:Uncharacterized protein n=2 Tax=Caenorhabditis japonica TaxID=281687 RepID=A0A8R1IWC9_CAEJA